MEVPHSHRVNKIKKTKKTNVREFRKEIKTVDATVAGSSPDSSSVAHGEQRGQEKRAKRRRGENDPRSQDGVHFWSSSLGVVGAVQGTTLTKMLPLSRALAAEGAGDAPQNKQTNKREVRYDCSVWGAADAHRAVRTRPVTLIINIIRIIIIVIINIIISILLLYLLYSSLY